MIVLSAAEISYEFFRRPGGHGEYSRGSFEFRLPLPRAEGLPDPGLPLHVKKISEQIKQPSRAVGRNRQVSLKITNVQLFWLFIIPSSYTLNK